MKNVSHKVMGKGFDIGTMGKIAIFTRKVKLKDWYRLPSRLSNSGVIIVFAIIVNRFIIIMVFVLLVIFIHVFIGVCICIV